MQVDDETLMAFADGELAEPEAGRLRLAIALDPALAARVEMFRKTRAAIAAIDPPPLPTGLEDRIRALAAQPAAQKPAAEVADLAAARHRRSVPFWQLPAAAAAALAAGVLFGQFMMSPPGSGDQALFAALDGLPSGESRSVNGTELSMIASFRDGAGTLCREYEATNGGRVTVAVSCREDGVWAQRLQIAAGPSEGYSPASSLDILDAWMDANAAAAPMSAEEEAEVLR